MTLWHYTKMGLQQGPVPEEELRQKIRRAEIGGSTLVWREGMADWLPLSQVAELNEPVAPAAVTSPGVDGSPQFPTSPPQTQQAVSHGLGHVPLPQPPAYQGNYITPKIPNYMWQSVVATVIGLPFCCLLAMPFGIVAIVFAAKVEGLRVLGDISGAWNASNNAKNWMIASYVSSGIGLALNLFSLITRSA